MAGPETTSEGAWRRFSALAVLAAAGLLFGCLPLAVVVDPYDTGRVTLLSKGAVRPQGPRTAIAVRGRDPAYRGAIIGNSHIQLVEPAALGRLTGVPFVQLSIPGTGPAEQFAVLSWYLRHHPQPEAIVLGADAFWCADDPAFPSGHPFPGWLLGDWPTYLRGLLRFTTVQETVNRLGWLANARRKVAVADGWWNYENDYLVQGYGRDPKLADRLENRAGPEPEPHRAGPFPIGPEFRAALAAIPAATPVVLVLPPVYAASEPPPGSPRAAAEAACRATILTELGRHARSAVVDWRNGRPQSRDPALFFDQSHYRLPVAEALTGEIASAITRLRADGTRRGL
jgi:hypothetical protein